MFKFEITEAMANIIMACLGKQPYETVAPVVDELRRQYALQQNVGVAEVKEDKDAA